MPHIGMTHEYENFLRQNNPEWRERRASVNPVSAEWIGGDTDSEASYMTEGETNHRRMSMDSDISDISDFSLSDTEDENGDGSDRADADASAPAPSWRRVMKTRARRSA